MLSPIVTAPCQRCVASAPPPVVWTSSPAMLRRILAAAVLLPPVVAVDSHGKCSPASPCITKDHDCRCASSSTVVRASHRPQLNHPTSNAACYLPAA